MADRSVLKCATCGRPVVQGFIDLYSDRFYCSRSCWGSGTAIDPRVEYTRRGIAAQAARTKSGVGKS